MKILQFAKYHRQPCSKCNSTGRYYVFPIPSPYMRTADENRMAKMLSNKPKKVYCGCEWGQDMRKARKEIESLPFDNPLKQMTDDQIRDSLKPLNPTPIQKLSKEEHLKLSKQKWSEAVEVWKKDRELKIYQNFEKRHY